jgi:hypothetical protein
MNIKLQSKTLLLYLIFILPVIHITSCKKIEPASVAIVTPPPVVVNNLKLSAFGNLSIARQDVVIAAVGTKILFAGGTIPDNSFYGFKPLSRVDIYDTVSNIWMTAELSIARNGIAVAISGSKVFFAGGYNFLPNGSGYDIHDESRVDIYDVYTNSWSTMELSFPRRNMAACTVGNKVFFAGGNYDIYTSPTLDIYDINAKTWSTSSITSRSALSAISINNKIYFAGGYDVDYMGDNAKDSKVVEVYDNASNSWSITTMSEAKTTYASISTGNTIFWAGNSYKIEMYDVVTGSHTLYDLGTNVNQSVKKINKLLFFNTAYTPERSKRVDIYDIATKAWLKYQLSQSIQNTGIISTGDKVYVAGGIVNGVLSNQVGCWIFKNNIRKTI